MSKPANSANKDTWAATSKYDPTRKTVGSIYLDAQKNKDPFVLGDMTNELMKGLVEDINQTAESDPFDGKPFYITVHEKKDLQMKKAILRRLIVSKFRPFPEDDTVVFHVEPRANKVDFCWALPHHSNMPNVLHNFALYPDSYVKDIQAFRAGRWDHFGFYGNVPGKIGVNTDHVDQTISK